MKYLTVEKEEIYLAGIIIDVDPKKGAHKAMASHWEAFFQREIDQKVPYVGEKNIYAVYTDYKGDYQDPYRYFLGMRVKSLADTPEELSGIIVPKQTYRLFIAKGEMPESLTHKWGEIWKIPDQDLPRSYRADFELYTERMVLNKPEVEVYVGVRN